jgi:hypothetical protein
MYSAFPRMKMLYFQTAEVATECQDLLGMEFRTTHFDGMAHVPSYTAWAMDCDMAPAYRTTGAHCSCCSRGVRPGCGT